MILEWMRGKKVGRCKLDPSGSYVGPVAGYYEHYNEPSSTIKGGIFVD
jgi:hypothetical protein